MKKYLLLIFSIFLFVISCASSEKQYILTEEEINQITINLKDDINEAIMESENKLSKEMKVFTTYSAYDRWRSELPGFKKLEADYLAQIDNVLKGALINVSDLLLSYVKSYEIEDANSLATSSYSSMSEMIKNNKEEDVKDIFKQAILDGSSSIAYSYQDLENEAYIWKSNLDNLALVGISNDLVMIDKIDDNLIASLATEMYFDVLSQSEVKIRTKREAINE